MRSCHFKIVTRGFQLEIVSFSEAVVNFTNDFRKEEKKVNGRNHRFLVSAKSLAVILPLEGEFIIGAAFNREECEKSNYFPHQGTLLKLVEGLYEDFQLFNGHFKPLLEKDRKSFERTLEQFFTNYLPTIPLIDYFDAISFMPLDTQLFIDAECFTAQCTEQCPDFQHAMFIYQNKLAQFTTNKHQLRSLYRFVTQHVIPEAQKQELQPETAPNALPGRFIKCRFEFASNWETYPKIHLWNDDNEDFEVFLLICYRALNATLCLLLSEKLEKNVDSLLPTVAAFLNTRLPDIASEMGESIIEPPPPVVGNTSFNYIYYNQESLSFQTSLKSSATADKFSVINFTNDMLTVIYDTFDKFVERVQTATEVNVKLDGDLWVGFKKAGGRMIAVFIPNSGNTTLPEMDTLFKTILETYFEHLHFL